MCEVPAATGLAVRSGCQDTPKYDLDRKTLAFGVPGLRATVDFGIVRWEGKDKKVYGSTVERLRHK